MKVYSCFILLILSFIYATDVKSMDRHQCTNVFNKLSEDNKNNFETIESQWIKYKHTCGVEGTYYEYLSSIYVSRGQFERALSILNKELNECDYDSRYLEAKLSSILYQQGNYLESRSIAETMIKKYPNWYKGYLIMGCVFMSELNWEKALLYLNKAKDIDPKAIEPYANLSSVYYEIGLPSRCIEIFEIMYELDSKLAYSHPRAIGASIISYVQTGNLIRSEELLDEMKKYNENPIYKHVYDIAYAEYSRSKTK